jgi:hypothetical protein
MLQKHSYAGITVLFVGQIVSLGDTSTMQHLTYGRAPEVHPRKRRECIGQKHLKNRLKKQTAMAKVALLAETVSPHPDVHTTGATARTRQ